MPLKRPSKSKRTMRAIGESRGTTHEIASARVTSGPHVVRRGRPSMNKHTNLHYSAPITWISQARDGRHGDTVDNPRERAPRRVVSP